MIDEESGEDTDESLAAVAGTPVVEDAHTRFAREERVARVVAAHQRKRLIEAGADVPRLQGGLAGFDMRAVAIAAREQQVEQTRIAQRINKPSGTTRADRNDQRLDAILHRALPQNAAGLVQRLLDRALDILYGEFGLNPDAVRALLTERRDPQRFASTAVPPRVADALADLSEIVTACEEAPDAAATRALSDAGISSDALLSGRLAARARKQGGSSTGTQRQDDAREKHEKWRAAAHDLLATNKKPHEIAGIVASRFGVDARTVRNELQRAGILTRREKRN